jgi:N-glycosylase/DNA lyase
MQAIAHVTATGVTHACLPDADAHVLPGIKWGRHDTLFTPAYWAYQAWVAEILDLPFRYKLGGSLSEEVAACLLGGYGIKAEVGLAAFRRVRDRGHLKGKISAREIFTSLSEPLEIGETTVRYRFAHQRSVYLAEALTMIEKEEPPADDLRFRLWLLKFRGIGPKTASWITRNWKDSDNVAIIDVHVCRAGELIGLYRYGSSRNDYFRMERDFLLFAQAVGVRVSVLDVIIWSQMRRWGGLAIWQADLH